MKTSVFDERTVQVIEKYAEASATLYRKASILYTKLIINVFVMLGVFGFEYEVFYRIFQYLAGDDHEFWTPWIMGCSSMILVVAIHALVSHNDDHPIHRFMNRITGFLVPIYLIGIGLLLVVMIYNDGLRDMLANTGGADGNSDPLAKNTEWINIFMEEFTTPIASVLFSAGIGAIAIINVFVAHHTMNTVQSTANHISDAQTLYLADKDDIAAYENARKHFDVQQGHIDTLIICDDDSLREVIANDVLLVIQDALAPAKKALNQLVHHKGEASLPFLNQQQKLNPKELEKSVKAISSIDLPTLIKHMK